MAGIYVHIPFCHAKCAYCDFFSTPRTALAPDTVRGIIREYASRLHELGGEHIDTVYLGGGTPSCLPRDLLEQLCSALPLHGAVERTIEVNPEDVSPASAVFWHRLGFNRVSMGVQSLVDSELAAVGRRHSAAEALEAIRVLRSAGFANISCDLIYGLPGQTLDSWRHSLRTLLSTGIEHLSAYSLSYEPGTRLSAMLAAGKIAETDEDIVASMYEELCSAAAARGFMHYEISNFARPGMHSRHNSSYWHAVPYLGLGPGAHSCDARGVRRASPCNISQWLQLGAQVEEETATDRLNDIIITGLRTAEGLDLQAIGRSEADGLLRRAARHLRFGRLIREQGHLRIPESAWLISDGIMRDLLED